MIHAKTLVLYEIALNYLTVLRGFEEDEVLEAQASGFLREGM